VARPAHAPPAFSGAPLLHAAPPPPPHAAQQPPHHPPPPQQQAAFNPPPGAGAPRPPFGAPPPTGAFSGALPPTGAFGGAAPPPPGAFGGAPPPPGAFGAPPPPQAQQAQAFAPPHAGFGPPPGAFGAPPPQHGGAPFGGGAFGAPGSPSSAQMLQARGGPGYMNAAPAPVVPVAELNPAFQCRPAYMSLTLGAVPKDEALLKRSELPFGVVCQPLAEGPHSLGRGRVPVVNFGAGGSVIRCKSCRAYVNPFAAFTDGGRRWRCNFCAAANDVPQGYFSPTDNATGARADLHERPELCSGSVEFVAPVEYMVRPPQPPVYVFVLDVSYNAVSSGVLAAACAAIKTSLRDIPGGERTLVGIITHDTAVNFYAFKKGARPPSAFVVSDIGVPNPGAAAGDAQGAAPGDELFLPALAEVRTAPFIFAHANTQADQPPPPPPLP
jgi:protein transport protein SEC24